MARRRGPAGVREQGMRASGSPRNLGGLVVSADNLRSGDRLPKPRPGAMRPSLQGANRGRLGGTAERRKRSEAGGAARSRIVSYDP